MTRYQYNEENNPYIWAAVEKELPIRRRHVIRALPGGAGVGVGFDCDGAMCNPTATAANTVTQAASKTTGVTMSMPTGIITMNAANLPTLTSATFIVTNTLVASGDFVTASHTSAGAIGSYVVSVNTIGAGVFSITVFNHTAGGLAEAIVITFVVLRASNIGTLVASAPVGTATTANSDGPAGTFQAIVSTAGIGDSVSLMTNFAQTRSSHEPDLSIRFQMGAGVNSTTDVRHWIGLFASNPSATSTIAAIAGAAFSFDSVADGTLFWRFRTSDGTTQQTTVTTLAIAAGVTTVFRIVFNTALGVVSGYIDGVLVASHGTNIPAAATPLGYGATVTVLAGASTKRILIDRMVLHHT